MWYLGRVVIYLPNAVSSTSESCVAASRSRPGAGRGGLRAFCWRWEAKQGWSYVNNPVYVFIRKQCLQHFTLSSKSFLTLFSARGPVISAYCTVLLRFLKVGWGCGLIQIPCGFVPIQHNKWSTIRIFTQNNQIFLKQITGVNGRCLYFLILFVNVSNGNL